MSLFLKKIEMLFVYSIEYSEPKMNKQQQEQQLFNRTAELLADDKITPEQACSFIETLRDAGIISDDTMEPEPEEQQKGFNEIAMVFADWKITREEACEAFNEWIDEWKTKKWKKNEEDLELQRRERTCENEGENDEVSK